MKSLCFICLVPGGRDGDKDGGGSQTPGGGRRPDGSCTDKIHFLNFNYLIKQLIFLSSNIY